MYYSSLKRRLQTLAELRNYQHFIKKCAFDECKANPVKMSSDEIMQQPIWNNCNFQYKGNILFFKSWVTCGVLHVKNLFNENGNFKTLKEYTNIENKSNWLCEYKILSSVFKPLCRKYDFSNLKFINIHYRDNFLFSSGYTSVVDKKCNFFTKSLSVENLSNRVIKLFIGEN